MKNPLSLPAYAPADDLFILSTYYNPHHFKTRLENARVFTDQLNRSGMHWLMVECAFQDQSFQLPDSDQLHRIRGNDVLWQKERLLNLALGQIPGRFTKIAWVDNDILFENPLWAVQASRLLEDFAVVQPFETVTMLSPESEPFDYSGLGAVYARDPDALRSGNFEAHGHTGFAWTARRDIFERHGFYDRFVGGGADEVMAHAFGGDWDSPCLKKSTGGNAAQEAHVIPWCEKIHSAVGSKIGYVEGRALHLWHGEIQNRQYLSRASELAALGFDPEKDLCLTETGLWSFAPHREDLRRWALKYFQGRKEDG
ncbi:MAG TPA: hypothetical protein VMU88_10975 [bacterium]|nr:hypothetical protein [bacterium]